MSKTYNAKLAREFMKVSRSLAHGIERHNKEASHAATVDDKLAKRQAKQAKRLRFMGWSAI